MPSTKVTYSGKRTEDGAEVKREREGRVTDLPLEPSLKLRNHSPTGFEWGYSGSGPAQLALAILLDYTGDEKVALIHYMDFKFDVIARLSHDSEASWHIPGEQINVWLSARAAKLKEVSREY